MQFQSTSQQQKMVLPVSDRNLNLAHSLSSNKVAELSAVEKANNVFLFQGSFLGYMDMYSDRKTVADYLDAHEGWFCRCSKPMQVEPLGENGYILSVGEFSYFGYDVQPKIAVVLNPPQNGIYRMHTVPIPGYQAPGYEVAYKSQMELQELDLQGTLGKKVKHIFKSYQSPSNTMIRVSWTLDMSVTVEFPKFILKLPTSLIQSTGDRLLAQIVRQISPRLTYKVQQDFHTRFNLPIPPKSGRKFDKIEPVNHIPNLGKNQGCAA